VEALIDRARTAVLARSGVALELEIQILGESSARRSERGEE
jgi:UDP-N-acetylenolpyruvoylglucosamine reductase